jgi:hypothetical protein
MYTSLVDAPVLKPIRRIDHYSTTVSAELNQVTRQRIRADGIGFSRQVLPDGWFMKSKPGNTAVSFCSICNLRT